MHGCWRTSFEVRVGHSEICDAFYNAAAGYRAQFARGIEHGVAGNHWLLKRLEPQLLQTCRERGIDTSPVTSSLRGGQAKLWIVEPKDDSHIKGAPAIFCRQWSGPGQLAPIAKRLEVKGAWLDSNSYVVADLLLTRSRKIERDRFITQDSRECGAHWGNFPGSLNLPSAMPSVDPGAIWKVEFAQERASSAFSHSLARSRRPQTAASRLRRTLSRGLAVGQLRRTSNGS